MPLLNCQVNHINNDLHQIFQQEFNFLIKFFQIFLLFKDLISQFHIILPFTN